MTMPLGLSLGRLYYDKYQDMTMAIGKNAVLFTPRKGKYFHLIYAVSAFKYDRRKELD